MWHQSARFEKSWPPFCQIWIIFTHLKLWIASARHNCKWVKIEIEYLAVKGLSAKHTNANATPTRTRERRCTRWVPLRQTRNLPACLHTNAKYNAKCEAFFTVPRPYQIVVTRENQPDAHKKCTSFDNVRVALRARLRADMSWYW